MSKYDSIRNEVYDTVIRTGGDDATEMSQLIWLLTDDDLEQIKTSGFLEADRMADLTTPKKTTLPRLIAVFHLLLYGPDEYLRVLGLDPQIAKKHPGEDI